MHRWLRNALIGTALVSTHIASLGTGVIGLAVYQNRLSQEKPIASVSVDDATRPHIDALVQLAYREGFVNDFVGTRQYQEGQKHHNEHMRMHGKEPESKEYIRYMLGADMYGGIDNHYISHAYVSVDDATPENGFGPGDTASILYMTINPSRTEDIDISFSPDGRLQYVRSPEAKLNLWEVVDGARATFKGAQCYDRMDSNLCGPPPK